MVQPHAMWFLWHTQSLPAFIFLPQYTNVIPLEYVVHPFCFHYLSSHAFLFPQHQVNLPCIHWEPLALTAISEMLRDTTGMSWHSLWHREEFYGHGHAHSLCTGWGLRQLSQFSFYVWIRRHCPPAFFKILQEQLGLISPNYSLLSRSNVYIALKHNIVKMELLILLPILVSALLPTHLLT